MGGVKQVKVDNWGTFFLQRLKQFFNQTDYCDLTLQFKDYAQLKVHRLVLNACTEYFEYLETTCEVYDDCLIMPDDLQADVVVPIVNFMYTGQLEYENCLFDRLYSTAQIMKITVLIKLLDSQIVMNEPPPPEPYKKPMIIMNEQIANKTPVAKPSTSENFISFEKKNATTTYRRYAPGPGLKESSSKMNFDTDLGRPTRYELPEELDNDEIFDSSFADISYDSLLTKKNQKRKLEGEITAGVYDDSVSSRKFEELKKIMYKKSRYSPDNTESKSIDLGDGNDFPYRVKSESQFQDAYSDDENDAFDSLIKEKDRTADNKERNNSNNSYNAVKFQGIAQPEKNIVKTDDKNPNVSFSHAKIISEVLKKYPHLVKTNKNIKLKIMNSKETAASQNYILEPQKKTILPVQSGNKPVKEENKEPDWVYVLRHDNLESMGDLIALGAENTSGPWLCLICGTPNKALKFTSYNAYYRHLVDVHKQRIPPKICEYCGFKSGKRNHLLHHMYTKHNIQPPAQYHFPKCNQCSYIALTEAFLVKHKLSHTDYKSFSCTVCQFSFRSRAQLMHHVYTSGHKTSPGRRLSTKCLYCDKVFLRQANLYAHMKVAHKKGTRNVVTQNSDEEYEDDNQCMEYGLTKYEEPQEEHVNIKQEYDGKIHIISNTQISKPTVNVPQQKLLNASFAGKVRENVRGYDVSKQYSKLEVSPHINESDQTSKTDNYITRNINDDMSLVDVVVLGENEYILHNEDSAIKQDMAHEEIDLADTARMIIQDLTEETEHTRIPQVITMNSLKTPYKVVQSVSNPGNSQNQTVQYVIAEKAVPTNAQIIYSGKKPDAVPNVPKIIQGQLENAQPGQVVMLNDEEFQIACTQSLASSGSNIVVVYNPVETVPTEQFADVQTTQESQEISQDKTETDVIMEDAVMHDMVEPWQEETVLATQDDKDEKNESEKTNLEEKCIEFPEESQEQLIEERPEMELNEEHQIPLETNEVEIPLTESENHKSNEEEICEQNELTMDIDESKDEQSNSPQGNIECIETTNSHNYAIQEKEEHQLNEIEMSDENVIKDPECVQEDEAEIQLNNSDGLSEEFPPTEQKNPEVEESIENIQMEIKKQFQVEAAVPDEVVTNSKSSDELNEDKVEEKNEQIVDDNLKDMDLDPVSDDSEEIVKENDVEKSSEDKDDVEMNAAENVEEVVAENVEENETENIEENETENGDDNPKKGSNVEKISHLLNEWEDNDSQTNEAPPNEDGKEPTPPANDSNIDKLMSDWDEEEEK